MSKFGRKFALLDRNNDIIFVGNHEECLLGAKRIPEWVDFVEIRHDNFSTNLYEIMGAAPLILV